MGPEWIRSKEQYAEAYRRFYAAALQERFEKIVNSNWTNEEEWELMQLASLMDDFDDDEPGTDLEDEDAGF